MVYLRLFLVQNGVIGLMSGSFAAIIIMFITRFKFIKYEEYPYFVLVFGLVQLQSQSELLYQYFQVYMKC